MAAMTLRLDDDLAQNLALVAAVDSESISDVIRAAIAAHIAERRANPLFRGRLEAHIENARQLLKPTTHATDPGATT